YPLRDYGRDSCLVFRLAVVSRTAMFAKKMFVVESSSGGFSFIVNFYREGGELGGGFANYQSLGGLHHRAAPGERRGSRNQNGRHFKRVHIFEDACNDMAGVLLVRGLHFFVGHGLRDGHRAAKVVGVGGSEARNRASRLRPGSRIFGMGVRDAADERE